VNLHRLVGCMQHVMLSCGNFANVCITPVLGLSFMTYFFSFLGSNTNVILLVLG
jgi:hypothetical protein